MCIMFLSKWILLSILKKKHKFEEEQMIENIHENTQDHYLWDTHHFTLAVTIPKWATICFTVTYIREIHLFPVWNARLWKKNICQLAKKKVDWW
jgi:hypothetical protein